MLYNLKQRMPRIPPSQILAADGAVTVKEGVVVITKATAAALTLAAPISGVDDYKKLTIVATTNVAHTVTNSTPGFNSGGAASDVATFGVTAGNTLELVAYQGAWYATNLKGVTLA